MITVTISYGHVTFTKICFTLIKKWLKRRCLFSCLCFHNQTIGMEQRFTPQLKFFYLYLGSLGVLRKPGATEKHLPSASELANCLTLLSFPNTITDFRIAESGYPFYIKVNEVAKVTFNF